MPLLLKLRLFPKWQRGALQTISATACNFCFLSRDEEQQLNHQKHHLCDKANWPPSTLSPPQIWLLRPLIERMRNVLPCETPVGLPGAGHLWTKDYHLHVLWGCASATSKCRHVMKGEAAGHLQHLISTQHILHNTPSSLLCTIPFFTVSCFISPSSSFIPRLRISSFPAVHQVSSCTLSLLSIFLLPCH